MKIKNIFKIAVFSSFLLNSFISSAGLLVPKTESQPVGAETRKGITLQSQCTVEFKEISEEKKNAFSEQLLREQIGRSIVMAKGTAPRAASAYLTSVKLSEQELRLKIEALLKDYPGTISSCRTVEVPDQDLPVDKPVIYLYPTQKQMVEVQLDYQGKLIAHYPDYNSQTKGWKVLAEPDGQLTNLADGQPYSYLFWEGISDRPIEIDRSQGFVVKGSDTKKFLQEILSKMGLTPKEYNEFIVYWFPQMEKNPYNFIHFAGQEYEKTAPLKISPKPDSILRVFMIFEALDAPIPITAQTITPFERKGFTVVEWGGMEQTKK